jgi:hypothetical protein
MRLSDKFEYFSLGKFASFIEAELLRILEKTAQQQNQNNLAFVNDLTNLRNRAHALSHDVQNISRIYRIVYFNQSRHIDAAIGRLSSGSDELIVSPLSFTFLGVKEIFALAEARKYYYTGHRRIIYDSVLNPVFAFMDAQTIKTTEDSLRRILGHKSQETITDFIANLSILEKYIWMERFIISQAIAAAGNDPASQRLAILKYSPRLTILDAAIRTMIDLIESNPEFVDLIDILMQDERTPHNVRRLLDVYDLLRNNKHILPELNTAWHIVKLDTKTGAIEIESSLADYMYKLENDQPIPLDTTFKILGDRYNDRNFKTFNDFWREATNVDTEFGAEQHCHELFMFHQQEEINRTFSKEFASVPYSPSAVSVFTEEEENNITKFVLPFRSEQKEEDLFAGEEARRSQAERLMAIRRQMDAAIDDYFRAIMQLQQTLVRSRRFNVVAVLPNYIYLTGGAPPSFQGQIIPRRDLSRFTAENLRSIGPLDLLFELREFPLIKYSVPAFVARPAEPQRQPPPQANERPAQQATVSQPGQQQQQQNEAVNAGQPAQGEQKVPEVKQPAITT